MTASSHHTTEHSIAIAAPAALVYDLIADAGQWPQIFTPTVHVEYLEKADQAERLRIWATANGTAKTWTSKRLREADQLVISFHQEQSQPPVGGMGGKWTVESLSPTESRVRLLHEYFAASDDQADLDWIDKAVDRNSTAELAALKAIAEDPATGRLMTFEDTVEVGGSARDVYDFLNEAQRWEQRLPHVARVSLDEQTGGLQILEMDTRTKDGTVHTTQSVRVCQPYTSIYYKQIVLPALLTLHTGRWLIEEQAGKGVSATSRHTVRIDESRIGEVLGEGADLAAARQFVRNTLSANSLATLRLAKSYAEEVEEAAGQRIAAP